MHLLNFFSHGLKLKLGSVITLDKRRLQMTSFGSREKCVIYRLDIIFSIAHVTQLMVSKINFFCHRNIRRYSSRDIRRRSYHVRKLKMTMTDCFCVRLGRDV